MEVHLIFRLKSLWIGAHYSAYNKRLCVNVLPCVTIAITLTGGNTPDKNEYKNNWRLI